MNYLDKYEFWLNNVLEKDQSALKNLTEDDLKERFGKDLTFGTGGIRGIMGMGSSMINHYTLAKVTHGYAKYLVNKNEGNKKRLKVVISYDNRLNSQSFALSSALIFTSYDIEVIMFEKLAPTPLLSYAIRHYKADGGIMITASHNPKEYNGYKVYDKTGSQLNLLESRLVIEEINKLDTWFFKDKSKSKLIKFVYHEVINSYLKDIKGILLNEGKYNKTNIKILYSPLHGTGSEIVPTALELNGFSVIPFWSHLINDPDFSNTPSTNPEEAITYDLLIDEAKKIDAGIIMVNDPDSDRLGIAVKQNDEFVLINGNQTASLILNYLLTYGKYKNKQMVYTTVVTTPLLKAISYKYNQHITETLTGFKFIGEQINLNEGKFDLVFAAEESYGNLISDIVRDKDGVQAVLLLSEIANFYYEQNKTLVDVLEDIYKEFGYFMEETISITMTGIVGTEKIGRIMNAVRENDLKLNNTKILEKIDYQIPYQAEFNLLPSDNVVKYIYEDNSWVVFRPSGTEPKLKIYIGVCEKDKKRSKQKIESIIKQLTDMMVMIEES